MARGKFITFEGIDGCGKSTQLEYFKKLLDEKGIPYLALREPGGTIISEKIRALLLDKGNSEMADETEVLLFAAARAQLVREVILPSLEKGMNILCDRFADSSVAYQAFGRQLGEELVLSANSFALSSCTPDCTLFFDASPASVRSRVEKRGESDRMESEKAAFHERVYEGYLEIAKREPERFIIIDASKDIETVNGFVRAAFEEIFA